LLNKSNLRQTEAAYFESDIEKEVRKEFLE
jgi:hypothetical protein